MDSPPLVEPSVFGNDFGLSEVTFHPTATAICSIGEAPFFAEVTVAYSPARWLLEFESFEEWVHALANRHESIESLTALIFDTLWARLEPQRLSVTCACQTTRHAPATATKEKSR